MIHLIQEASKPDILKTILDSRLAKSLAGKAFVLNLLPEIGSLIIYKDVYILLTYVSSCVILVIFAWMIENEFTVKTVRRRRK